MEQGTLGMLAFPCRVLSCAWSGALLAKSCTAVDFMWVRRPRMTSLAPSPAVTAWPVHNFLDLLQDQQDSVDWPSGCR